MRSFERKIYVTIFGYFYSFFSTLSTNKPEQPRTKSRSIM